MKTYTVEVVSPAAVSLYKVTAPNRTSAKAHALQAHTEKHGQRAEDCRVSVTSPAPKAKPSMPNYAGLRQYRKVRSTGTLVGVYDGIAAGFDVEGGRWQTVCEEHGHIISHETLKIAVSHASCPEEWCEACMGR